MRKIDSNMQFVLVALTSLFAFPLFLAAVMALMAHDVQAVSAKVEHDVRQRVEIEIACTKAGGHIFGGYCHKAH